MFYFFYCNIGVMLSINFVAQPVYSRLLSAVATYILLYLLSAFLVLRKLVVYGFKDPRDHESVRTFIQQIFYGINSMVEAGQFIVNNFHMTSH